MSEETSLHQSSRAPAPITVSAKGQSLGLANVWSAFAAAGLLIGLLTGMTATSVVSSLLSLLFTFLGGSVLVMLQKLSDEQIRTAYKGVFSLSVGCIVGLFAGLIISERQLLTPFANRAAERREGAVTPKYLKTSIAEKADAINADKETGRLSVEEAYGQLLRLSRGTGEP